MNECPNCHAQHSFEDVECFDQEWFGDSYYDYCQGTCNCCGKIYRWSEVYTFNKIVDIEEVTDN